MISPHINSVNNVTKHNGWIKDPETISIIIKLVFMYRRAALDSLDYKTSSNLMPPPPPPHSSHFNSTLFDLEQLFSTVSLNNDTFWNHNRRQLLLGLPHFSSLTLAIHLRLTTALMILSTDFQFIIYLVFSSSFLSFHLTWPQRVATDAPSSSPGPSVSSPLPSPLVRWDDNQLKAAQDTTSHS